MATSAADTAFERHYSVEELCEQWKMSDDFIRAAASSANRGVVVFSQARPGRRVYRTLRIPESVAKDVHRRMRKATM